MLHIGIDVGGTNTDSVLLEGKKVLHYTKINTTDNIIDGVKSSLCQLLKTCPEGCHKPNEKVTHINIGTTHCINAILQRKHLAKVSVIRVCGPTTKSLPPFTTFPESLAKAIQGSILYIDGGYNFDGSVISNIVNVPEIETKAIISNANRKIIEDFIEQQLIDGSCNFVVVGVFSPVCSDQEKEIGKIIRNVTSVASFTLSHQIGSIGFIERENASILNECLKPLTGKMIDSFELAVADIACDDTMAISNDVDLFITQNDGTLIDSTSCKQFPVKTICSGSTNSMRGAAYLSGLQDILVIDIGGTSTDAGLVVNGFPKPSSTKVEIGGVKTNFTMPEVKSIGIGGGSIIHLPDDYSSSQVLIGPQSVALNLKTEAQIFGGNVLTLTDIGVLEGKVEIGDKDLIEKSQHISKEDLNQIQLVLKRKLETLIESVRISSQIVPIYFVGGGANVIIPDNISTFCGLPVLQPKIEDMKLRCVANALGAALCDVSITFDSIVDLKNRDQCLDSIRKDVVDQICNLGAVKESVRIVDITEINLPYIPGFQARVIMKAVGELSDDYKNLMANKMSSLNIIENNYPKLSVENKIVNSNTEENCNWSSPKDVSKPKIVNKLWTLSEYDVWCISIGAGILGCGGGGSPSLAKDILINEMRKNNVFPKILSAETLKTHVSPMSYGFVIAEMGSPTICMEKIAPNETLYCLVNAMKYIDKFNDGDLVSSKTFELLTNVSSEETILSHLICAEIGGGNSIIPLIAALSSDLPVLDADCMGRAFPELQMCYPFIENGQRPVAPVLPAVLSDEFGNCLIKKDNLDGPKELENYFRVECLKRGCSSGVALCRTQLSDVNDLLIKGSYSRAWYIGNAVLQSRIENKNSVEAICDAVNGKVFVSGKIIDVLRRIDGGWAKGHIIIENDTDQTEIYKIDLQNEYLTLLRLKKNSLTNENEDKLKDCVACVPDLISIVDKDSGEAIMSDEARYGLRIQVLVIPAPPQLTTHEALKIVGPSAFGFTDLQYIPCIDAYKEISPVV